MNPWTALLIGLVLGWLIEFAIDWFFWRRKTSNEKEAEELQTQLQEAEGRVAELETELAVARGEVEPFPEKPADLETGYADDESEGLEPQEVAFAGAATAAIIADSADDDEIEPAYFEEMDEGTAVAAVGMEEISKDFDSDIEDDAADDFWSAEADEVFAEEAVAEDVDQAEDLIASEAADEVFAEETASEDMEEVEEFSQETDLAETGIMEDEQPSEEPASVEEESAADDFGIGDEASPDELQEVEEAPEMDGGGDVFEAEDIAGETPSSDMDSPDMGDDEAGEGESEQ